ncbi:MAG: GNAT family N-acetyltransferase [Wenzhouxiangella sp.]
MGCFIARSATELARWGSALDELAANAAEPNIFFEREMLSAALECLDAEQVEVLLVFDDDQLVGLLPLERTARFHGLPISALRTWQHLHCFLGTPLVRAGSERFFFNALLDWLDSRPSKEVALELNGFGRDGGLWATLQAVLKNRQRHFFCTLKLERALLVAQGEPDEYLASCLGNKKRRELRRQQRRLGELGELEFQNLTASDDIEEWIQDFLALEQSGWKGRAGTAMALDPAEQCFFQTVMRQLFESNRLLMLRLRLDGRTISTQVNFSSGPGAFSFKVAFDEAYAKYSPGVLLELENIRQRLFKRDIEWMDSCTSSSGGTMDSLWCDRKSLGRTCIATAHPLSRPTVRLFRLYSGFRGRRAATLPTGTA